MFYLSTQFCIGLRNCSFETGTSLGPRCTVYQLAHTSVMMAGRQAVDYATAASMLELSTNTLGSHMHDPWCSLFRL